MKTLGSLKFSADSKRGITGGKIAVVTSFKLIMLAYLANLFIYQLGS